MFKQIIKNRISLISKSKNKQGGFTLVEALTAIFILTFVVVGLMTVVSDSLFATKYAKDEITVNYLLQEAIDYVRNDRDTMVFLNREVGIGDAWTSFYTKYTTANCNNTTSGCSLDVNTSNGNLISCPSSGCSNLYLDESITGNYFYSTESLGTTRKIKTNFKRMLNVTSVGDSQIEVKATVYWRNGNSNKSRFLTTTLSKWQ